jgi:hypothetical protein
MRSPGPVDRGRLRLRRLTGDIGPAQKHFPAVLEMGTHEDLRGLARDGRREIAACELKARGPRKDGGLCPAGHNGCFAGGRWARYERSPSRSVFRENTGWISTTPRRATSRGCCRGGPYRRWDWCA